MARTVTGAVLEMFRREFASRFYRDIVLELETGPATTEQLSGIDAELKREFPNAIYFLAGGDEEGYWKISVRFRSIGAGTPLREDLARWASRNPFVRKYSVRQRSLWRTA
jgi:hypothetical protein